MIILYTLLVILAIFAVLALAAPKKYDVRRTVVINKPLSEVFQYVKLVENQNIWSPWKRRDPEMKQFQTGIDGTVGFINRWESDHKQVGVGEQEIKAFVENERVDSELRFYKPWKSQSDAFFLVKELEPSQTEVIWGFVGSHSVPLNVMMLFFNMDKVVGKDFDEGLSELKRVLEMP